MKNIIGSLGAVITGGFLSYYEGFVMAYAWNSFIAGWYNIPNINSWVCFGFLMVFAMIVMSFKKIDAEVTDVAELYRTQAVHLIATGLFWCVIKIATVFFK